MPEFIRREEFSAEMRQTREDITDTIRDGHAALAKSVEALSSDMRRNEDGWRNKTVANQERIQELSLVSAVHDQKIGTLLSNTQIADLKSAMDMGFSGIIARLDTANGRLAKHDDELFRLRNLRQQDRDKITWSRKTKAALATGSGVGLIAVLHSLFEMIRTIGPAVAGFFGHPSP